ncbi:MAG TPA: argininosuccinate synthase domain-containing protein, partial [Parafilimonas sp.]|nr:argininosuccinate synthase domain-containing protein [Parafilimonas sp.]
MSSNQNNDVPFYSHLGDGGVSRIVLGFSGGLDTSFCVKYLTQDKGYEVHSIIVNTGGFSDDEL